MLISVPYQAWRDVVFLGIVLTISREIYFQKYICISQHLDGTVSWYPPAYTTINRSVCIANTIMLMAYNLSGQAIRSHNINWMIM